jgi:methylmalonyl-CoA/ethylmalonyl-CoA epimerase
MSSMHVVTGGATLANSFVGDTLQVCVVTRDYRKAMEGMARLGIGPWRVYTFSPETATELTFRGRPATYSMKLCLAFSGNMMWEIVQSLSGPNVYEEFLERHGEGMHHVAVACNGMAWEARVKEFEGRGFKMVQSGRFMGVPNAYFETEDATGATFEILGIPEGFVMPEPEEWYPGPPPEASKP